MTVVFNYRNVNYFTPLFTIIRYPENRWVYDKDDDEEEYNAWVVECVYGEKWLDFKFKSEEKAFEVYNELLSSIEEYYREVGKYMKVIR